MKIYLKPFTEQDLNNLDYREWFNNKDAVNLSSHKLFPKTENDYKKYIQSFGEKNIVFKIMIESNLVSGWVGNISLQSIHWVYRSAELAIFIGNTDAWGKGVGQKACSQLLDYAFNTLNLNRVWTGTSKLNYGMRKIAEKIGMKQEGVFKDAMFLNGAYVDVYEYAILREEYENR